MIENYIDIFKTKYFKFSGRATRSEFWYFHLVNFIILILFSLIGSVYIYLIIRLIILIPSIAVSVRRLHDIGEPGWVLFIPIVNIIYMFNDSDKKDNKYGKYKEFRLG